MGSRIERHLSRLAMPKTWKIKRKGIKWVTRPLPGPHSYKLGLPLNLLLRDLLKLSKTTKETKKIINNKDVLIDGVVRKEHRFSVGIMDVVSIPKIKKQYRILFNKRGHITTFPIDEKEANIKPCKIIKKTIIKKGKLQLNLYDGKNILTDEKGLSVGDTILIELPSQKIKQNFKFEKGSIIYLIGGKHIGKNGEIKEIKGNKITYKKEKDVFETLKKYAFVIGKDKSSIKLPE